MWIERALYLQGAKGHLRTLTEKVAEMVKPNLVLTCSHMNRGVTGYYKIPTTFQIR